MPATAEEQGRRAVRRSPGRQSRKKNKTYRGGPAGPSASSWRLPQSAFATVAARYDAVIACDHQPRVVEDVTCFAVEWFKNRPDKLGRGVHYANAAARAEVSVGQSAPGASQNALVKLRAHYSCRAALPTAASGVAPLCE